MYFTLGQLQALYSVSKKLFRFTCPKSENDYIMIDGIIFYTISTDR
jgi:hypothetical protein